MFVDFFVYILKRIFMLVIVNYVLKYVILTPPGLKCMLRCFLKTRRYYYLVKKKYNNINIKRYFPCWKKNNGVYGLTDHDKFELDVEFDMIANEELPERKKCETFGFNPNAEGVGLYPNFEYGETSDGKIISLYISDSECHVCDLDKLSEDIQSEIRNLYVIDNVEIRGDLRKFKKLHSIFLGKDYDREINFISSMKNPLFRLKKFGKPMNSKFTKIIRGKDIRNCNL